MSSARKTFVTRESTSTASIGELRPFVEEIKRAREAAGLTLAEVSRRCGIDQPALSRLENGHNKNPTLDTLWRYAAAVGTAPGPDHQSHPRHAAGAGQGEAGPCGTREVETAVLICSHELVIPRNVRHRVRSAFEGQTPTLRGPPKTSPD